MLACFCAVSGCEDHLLLRCIILELLTSLVGVMSAKSRTQHGLCICVSARMVSVDGPLVHTSAYH